MYRILMIAPTPFFADRGCHVRILGEVRALQAAGHRVTVCTYHHGRDVEGVHTVRIAPIPGYRKLSAGPSNAKYVADPLLLARSLREARRDRPDVVHGHLHEGALIGRFVSAATGAPLVFDYQGSLTEELAAHGYLRRNSRAGRAFARLERWIDSGAAGIVASSDRAADALRSSVAPERVHTVLDGVDTQEFRPLPRPERAAIRARFDVPEDAVLALYVGVLADYQGIDLLLTQLGPVLAERPALHVLLAGYPEEGYRRRVTELGLQAQVLLPGRVPYEETRALTGAADIGLTPKLSVTEGNLKVYNYLACGLPVVAFDNPVNREILGDLGVYADCSARTPPRCSAKIRWYPSSSRARSIRKARTCRNQSTRRRKSGGEIRNGAQTDSHATAASHSGRKGRCTILTSIPIERPTAETRSFSV
ncbi:MAG: glycosyltransferase [Gemmatimonadota bacterium]